MIDAMPVNLAKTYKIEFERIFNEYRTRKVVQIFQSDEEKHNGFCGNIDTIVNQLEPDERFLITERYMKSTRITDMKVYCFSFDPPISAVTYAKIRESAFKKLAIAFNELGYIAM